MDRDILNENDATELEFLEFVVSDNHYGINVAKVREILNTPETTPIPNARNSIMGMFMLRDDIVTVINTALILGLPWSDDLGRMLIVTNFNNLHISFMVDRIAGIKKVLWTDIIKPDESVSTSGTEVATGIVHYDDKLIIMLDFESIIEKICPETGIRMSDLDYLGERERNVIPIIVAEDSPLLRKLVVDSLNIAGYTSIISFDNGEEVWKKLLEYKENKCIAESVKCIITDIEMPQMDGHMLIKNIRGDFNFDDIPIVIFSSLINEDTKRKGIKLGADLHITKPEIGKLVHVIDDLIVNGRK